MSEIMNISKFNTNLTYLNVYTIINYKNVMRSTPIITYIQLITPLDDSGYAWGYI